MREVLKLFQYRGPRETQSCFNRNYIVAWWQERGIYAASPHGRTGRRMKDVTSFGLDVEAAQMPRSQSRQFVPHDKQCGDLKNPPGRTLPPHSGQNILISLSTLPLQAGHLGRNTMNKVMASAINTKTRNGNLLPKEVPFIHPKNIGKNRARKIIMKALEQNRYRCAIGLNCSRKICFSDSL